MRFEAVLFDLDDTLYIEESAAMAAILATCREAERTCGTDAEALAQTLRRRARALWHALPSYDWCRRIGISSWEGLWARFEGPGEPLAQLRSLKDGYALNAWRGALAEHGVDDGALARRLAEHYRADRRTRHALYPDAAQALDFCAGRVKTGLITNGVPDLQWEKIHGAGIERHFHSVTISGDVGEGKPAPAIFAAALGALAVPASRCLIVGDSLKADVAGGNAASLYTVWLNRGGRAPGADEAMPNHTITELGALADLLNA